MFQYSRLDILFNIIRKNEFTSVAELQSRLNISDRTIRNDIQELNDTLQTAGAIVKLKRNHGYYIEITASSDYQKFVEEFEKEDDQNMDLDTSEDRIRYILKLLLSTNDYIAMDDLAETVYISKNTLNKYIKTIKEMLKDYDLEYITKLNAGIRIIGSEESKRKLLITQVLHCDFKNQLTGFSKEERAFFQGIDLDWLKKATTEQLAAHLVKTSDYNLKNIIIHLALMTSRVMGDNYITLQNIQTDSSIMDIVDDICTQIETHYHIAISQGEKNYVYLQIVANTHLDITTIDDDKLRESIAKMLEIIYTDFNFDLRHDEVLSADLFRHLKSIFTSKLYNLNSTNPLLETIKTNYPLEYEITLTAISKVFVFEPYILKEEDVGYISIYIGASIERCYYKSPKKKNVLLLCGSGRATTRMLEARLNVVFPDKIHIVKSVSYYEYSHYTKEDVKGIDFVISTIKLDNPLLPSIMVDFALNSKDVESINRYLAKLLRKRLQTFDRFFDRDLFFQVHEEVDKEAIIHKMYDRLHEKGMVDERFLASVLKREDIGKTNMNNVFALPHPMELLANETKVAVALLDKPIKWNESDSIQIVFMLVFKQGEQKDFEHLYDIFIEIINNPKLQQNILKSANYEEFMDVLYEGMK